MQPKPGTRTKLQLAFALAVALAVGGGVAWRLWFSDRVTLEGPMREGSLRCDDECHFNFVLEVNGGTRVRAETCIMPDTLRDWPGHPVQVMVAGSWAGEKRLRATALLTSSGYWSGSKPSGGRPAACFVPPAQR